jgi:hypothetical protein
MRRWPWYTNIAPASWLVQRDVDEGRSTMNLSELGRTEVEIDVIAETIREGADGLGLDCCHRGDRHDEIGAASMNRSRTPTRKPVEQNHASPS